MYRVGINNDILKQWQERYSELPLVLDGVVSPSTYWQEKVKVVICLKEAVMYESGNPLLGDAKAFKGEHFKTPKDTFDLTPWLYNTGGDDSPTWINECKVAELLMDGKITSNYEDPIHRRQIFKRIGHIELSKLGGTKYESEWYRKVIEDNKDLIGRQLSNFDANYYIICGKTSWDIVKSVINLEHFKSLEVDVPNNGGKMEFWHSPENNKTLILMYHLSDMYRFNKQLEVLKKWVKS